MTKIVRVSCVGLTGSYVQYATLLPSTSTSEAIVRPCRDLLMNSIGASAPSGVCAVSTFSIRPFLVHVVRVRARAVVAFKRPHAVHVCCLDFEVENGKVLLDPPRGTGFGNDEVPKLEMPPEDYLGRCPAVFVSQIHDRGVGKDLPAAKGAPCFGSDPELFMQCPQPALLKPGVQLYLINGRDHFGFLHEFFQMPGLEIRNP